MPYRHSPGATRPAHHIWLVVAVAVLLAAIAALPGQSFGGGAQGLLTAATASPSQASANKSSGLDVRLPLEPKSIRFAVIGDSGTGDRPEYEVGELMAAYQEVVGFDFVIMLGDNIYGGDAPGDFARKFELPFKALLSA